MEIYNVIADWTGWPVVVGLLLLGMSYGYWVLQNRIDLLKEKCDLLMMQISQQQAYSPDAVLQRLLTRHKALTDELEMLMAEKDVNLEKIKQLNSYRNDVITLLVHEVKTTFTVIANKVGKFKFDNPRMSKQSRKFADEIEELLLQASHGISAFTGKCLNGASVDDILGETDQD